MIWTVIEPGLGITAASLATLGPLVRKVVGRGSSAERPYPRPTESKERNMGGILAIRSVKQTVSTDGLEAGLMVVQISSEANQRE